MNKMMFNKEPNKNPGAKEYNDRNEKFRENFSNKLTHTVKKKQQI